MMVDRKEGIYMKTNTDERAQLRFRADEWMWSATWEKFGVRASEGSASITVDGMRFRLRPSGEQSTASVKDILGAARETVSTLGAEGSPVQVTLKVRRYEGQLLVGVQGEIFNHGDRPCALEDFELVTRTCIELRESGRGVRAYIERSPGHPTIEPLCAHEEGNEVPLEADSHGMVTLTTEETRRTTITSL